MLYCAGAGSKVPRETKKMKMIPKKEDDSRY
jgi:hypothetical protein